MALKEAMNADSSPAITSPRSPIGMSPRARGMKRSASSLASSFSCVPAWIAKRAKPTASAQRTIMNTLQAAPTLAASRGFWAARNRWKSDIWAGPPRFNKSPLSTQAITRRPKNWYAA